MKAFLHLSTAVGMMQYIVMRSLLKHSQSHGACLVREIQYTPIENPNNLT
jgi:hypothetical protein